MGAEGKEVERKTVMVKAVYRVDWTERERGWVPKPMGHTDFKTLKAAQKAIKKHWNGYSDNSVPDYYISPSEPYLIEIEEEKEEKEEKEQEEKRKPECLNQPNT